MQKQLIAQIIASGNFSRTAQIWATNQQELVDLFEKVLNSTFWWRHCARPSLTSAVQAIEDVICFLTEARVGTGREYIFNTRTPEWGVNRPNSYVSYCVEEWQVDALYMGALISLAECPLPSLEGLTLEVEDIGEGHGLLTVTKGASRRPEWRQMRPAPSKVWRGIAPSSSEENCPPLWILLSGDY